MKNKYKINEILDAVNVILNHKDKMTEKKKEKLLRPVSYTHLTMPTTPYV